MAVGLYTCNGVLFTDNSFASCLIPAYNLQLLLLFSVDDHVISE